MTELTARPIRSAQRQISYPIHAPYSPAVHQAKTVYFYNADDSRHKAVSLPVTSKRYRNIESLCNDLNERVPLNFGVRRIHTPMGRHEIKDVNALQHNAKYVCSSFHPTDSFIGRQELSSLIDRLYLSKTAVVSRQYEYNSGSMDRRRAANKTASPPGKVKHRSDSQGPKQVVFTLNGVTSKFHKILFRPSKLPSLNEVLKELSTVFGKPIVNIYAPTGEQVENTRFFFTGPSKYAACTEGVNPEGPMLPPISQRKKLPVKAAFSVSESIPNQNGRAPAVAEKRTSLPHISSMVSPVPSKLSSEGSTGGRKKKKVEKLPRTTKARDITDSGVSSQRSDTKAAMTQDQAAAKIQAGVKGYITRKQMKSESDAATKIQTRYKTYKKSKGRKESNQSVTAEPKVITLTATATEPRPKPDDRQLARKCLYNVTIFTGNRWCADTVTDLYLILHGIYSSTTRIWLRQADDQIRFSQNQMDTFEVTAKYVGELTSVTIGHECGYYGGGIFLDRVIVTDAIVDMQQYLFPVHMWLDAGQVDGKIERVVQNAGFYDLHSLSVTPPTDRRSMADNDEENKQYNIWQMTVKTASHKSAGTTSKVFITGLGLMGQSKVIPLEDENLKVSESESRFEIDFGDIGPLVKLRFSLVEAGKRPAWLLEWVELRNIELGERMHLVCNKWLSGQDSEMYHRLLPDKGQGFRELPMLRVGSEPLLLNTYQLMFNFGDVSSGIQSNHVAVTLHGEFGSSGSMLLNLDVAAKKKNYEMLLESAALGRLLHVELQATVSETGMKYTSGIAALQDVYEKHDIKVMTGEQWLVRQVTVRGSQHEPFEFVMRDSEVAADEDGRVVKRLHLTGAGADIL